MPRFSTSTTWARVRLLSVLVAGGLLAACTGPTGGQDSDREPPDMLPTPANLADYEDFDPAPYAEEVPDGDLAVVHDVPNELMEGRAAEGLVQTIQGFRIQIASTQDKAEADETVERAVRWWSANKEEVSLGPTSSDTPVYLVYRQPYYRVRIGDFASRAQAEATQAALEARFPGAFIVPDQVTIVR